MNYLEDTDEYLCLGIFRPSGGCCLYLKETRFIFCTNGMWWHFIDITSREEISVKLDDFLYELTEMQQTVILFNLDLFKKQGSR